MILNQYSPEIDVKTTRLPKLKSVNMPSHTAVPLQTWFCLILVHMVCNYLQISPDRQNCDIRLIATSTREAACDQLQSDGTNGLKDLAALGRHVPSLVSQIL